MKNYITIGLMALVIALPATAAKVYRWVDSNGQVHYGSEKPTNTKAAVVKVAAPKIGTESALPKKTEGDKKQEQYDREAKQKAVEYQAQLKKACEGMRKDLAVYKNNRMVRVKVDNEVRRLTTEELTERITKLENDIGKNCQDF